MKLKKQGIFSFALLSALAATGSQALAQTAMVAELGTISGQTLNLTLPVANTHDYFTGSQNISVNGASFLAFCIDPFQYASGSPAQYNVYNSLTSLFNVTRANNITKLYSQAYAGTTGNNQNSAAFQLALWELANDDGSLSTGGVKATNLTTGAAVAATTMLFNVANSAAGATQYTFNLYAHPTNQDFLLSVTAVPEPETYAMLLTGIGLLGAVARRRKQQG